MTLPRLRLCRQTATVTALPGHLSSGAAGDTRVLMWEVAHGIQEAPAVLGTPPAPPPENPEGAEPGHALCWCPGGWAVR